MMPGYRAEISLSDNIYLYTHIYAYIRISHIIYICVSYILRISHISYTHTRHYIGLYMRLRLFRSGSIQLITCGYKLCAHRWRYIALIPVRTCEKEHDKLYVDLPLKGKRQNTMLYLSLSRSIRMVSRYAVTIPDRIWISSI